MYGRVQALEPLPLYIMPSFPASILTCLLIHTSHAEEAAKPADDTPSPQQLSHETRTLQDKLNKLIRLYKSSSTGKRWGRSPGHKSAYQALLHYRDELGTLLTMSQPGK